ncbi:hypothetical protein [Polyangium mundeleinium]|uniref:Lipoprotein n=1 Tax=Polyangium mundeleinium TaxID=2995306 RepID=A0ABT5EHM6_9BACT|nr:hypothetical protein [Polyangium mundeleinium]MDC0741261.1 hypothetical protein [Polyangium mundeleinium]
MHLGLWMMGFSAVILLGCGGGDVDLPEDVLEGEDALMDGNRLSSNSLALNSLALNSLALNGIAPNKLDAQSLAAIRAPTAQGELARAFVRYAVGCALTPLQSVSFSWTDAAKVVHQETYPGELGIAPAWAAGPLDLNGQRMVSACVAARVNYYQVPVLVSLRSMEAPLRLLAGARELVEFPDVEGAFWGNLWGASPAIYACYNSATVENSRAWSRDCATGHLRDDGTIEECGMIDVVGPCSSVCASLNGGGQYYPFCVEKPYAAGNANTKLVITTALP